MTGRRTAYACARRASNVHTKGVVVHRRNCTALGNADTVEGLTMQQAGAILLEDGRACTICRPSIRLVTPSPIDSSGGRRCPVTGCLTVTQGGLVGLRAHAHVVHGMAASHSLLR